MRAANVLANVLICALVVIFALNNSINIIIIITFIIDIQVDTSSSPQTHYTNKGLKMSQCEIYGTLITITV